MNAHESEPKGGASEKFVIPSVLKFEMALFDV